MILVLIGIVIETGPAWGKIGYSWRLMNKYDE
jgi:hypothetical protein